MGFFDLNIPYDGTTAAGDKSSRIKVVVKAMELGYSGVAYNRKIKGVMSDSDSCSIPPLSLSSLLKLAPSLSSSVRFHRSLLGVPLSSPFRQYTRLTVAVDSSPQASALNSGNPVLKSYDLVAVRPLNQNAFDQACQVSEVDLIAIDFSEKLPFRLKLPMVKAAIKRGVYFEITYSNLISDVQSRKQVISNAKLLVDWTRGNNLIFSSAAPSVNELRGPYDVANLSSLLGLSMERAKAAISKNCRSLIANALRKKQFYKEAIRVELIPSSEFDSNEPWSGNGLKWDPISSGEGDLLLDDMAKSFSAAGKVSKTVKAIDFASIVDNMSSHGLQLKDLLSGTKSVLQPVDNVKNSMSVDGKIGAPVPTNGGSEQPDMLKLFPETERTSSYNTPSKCQISGHEDSKKSFSPNDTSKADIDSEEIKTHTTITEEEPNISNGLVDFSPIRTEIDNLQSEECTAGSEANVVLPDDNLTLCTALMDIECDAVCNADADGKFEVPIQTRDVNLSVLQNEESRNAKGFDVVLGAQSVTVDEVLVDTNMKNEASLSLASNNVLLHENSSEIEFREPVDDSVLLSDGTPPVECYDELKGSNDSSVANHELLDEMIVEAQKQADDSETEYPTINESISGKAKAKQRTPRRAALLFPFKRLVSPVLFKKKAHRKRNKTT
ncbi:protein GAMETOPHYTE DEFECTIVE 1 [Vitis riparia]|uniref:protein GAMETOPHYTE DEFECTIVE 1 n=1 Tax=Vitis riparia TaxID=96939 RepID=UPI00155A556D|nr:protein GAMETOPHYTE DEFECTIVE 1 [Vitis riparia]